MFIFAINFGKYNRGPDEMIPQLVVDHKTVVRTVREIFPIVDATNDESSADLPPQRMPVHKKTAWLLRCMLQ